MAVCSALRAKKLEGNHFLSYKSEQLYSLNVDIWLATALLTYVFQTRSVLGRSIITEKSRNAHRLFALIWLTRHRFLMNNEYLWKRQRGEKRARFWASAGLH